MAYLRATELAMPDDGVFRTEGLLYQLVIGAVSVSS